MPGYNYPKTSGTSKFHRNDRGDANIIREPIIAVVKDNIDPNRSGRIRVYSASYCGNDPDDSNSWIPVDYLSPWFGVASPNYNLGDNATSPGYGEYVSNPHSYGWWASSPDIGTRVICIFIDGLPDQGYYIGCVPPYGLTHMVPAIGSSTVAVPNESEAQSYGDAPRLPVTEVNYDNPTIVNSPGINSEPRPVHSYQAAILFKQGLIRDPDRGVISSSSQRETPSRVFGMSTPGGPIYNGGYTDKNISSAIAEGADASKLQIVGRRGGHTFVMDDGDINGNDQLVRLRTSAGHTILLNDSSQSVTVIHSNGQSWMELGKEGTIDMFSTNSVNIRTQGDLNLHADRDVNIHAGRGTNLWGRSLQLEAESTMSMRSGGALSQYAGIAYTVKSDGAYSVSAKDVGLTALGRMSLVGLPILLNSGSPATPPPTVPELPKVQHPETQFDADTKRGWITPGPQPLFSITSRLTTHWPYAGAGLGVDVTVDPTARISNPSGGLLNTIVNSGAVPPGAISAAVAATSPVLKPVTNGGNVVISGQMVGAIAAQNSASGLGEVPQSPLGLSLRQAENAGENSLLKPGAAEFIKSRQTQGLGWAISSSGPLYTGNGGVLSATDMQNNYAAQAGAVGGSMQVSHDRLMAAGAINGTESSGQLAGVVNAGGIGGAAVVAKSITGIGVTPLSATNTVAVQSGSWVQGLWNNVNGGVQSLGTSISNSITNLGTTIRGLPESISGGLSKLTSGGGLNALTGGTPGGILGGSIGSLAGSVSGLLGALGGLFGRGPKTRTLDSLAKEQASTTERAYRSAVGGITPLVAGQPNALGGGTVVTQLDRTESTLIMYEQSNALTAAALSNLQAAQNEYSRNPSALNSERVQIQQAALREALVREQQVAQAVVTGITPAQSVAIQQANNNKQNGVDWRAFALRFVNNYGGIEGLFARTRLGQSIVPKIQQTVSTLNSRIQTATGIVNVLSNPQLMAGNVMNKVSVGLSNMASNYIDTQINKIGGKNAGTVREILQVVGVNTAPGAFFGSIRTLLGSIGTSIIRKPAAATGTYASNALQSVTAGLLGDPRVPPPNFQVGGVQISPNVYLQQQSKVQSEITTLLRESDSIKEQINAKIEMIGGPESNSTTYREIVDLQSRQQTVLRRLQVLEAELAALQTAK